MFRVVLAFLYIFSLLLPIQSVYAANTEEDITFSRLIIYDVRGKRKDETVIILEQKNQKVKVWLKDYMGQRSGVVPLLEYQRYFKQMKKIKKFALKKKYRGKLLRTNAAHGLITLAWKDKHGKQIETIKYYAPEHTLDDFRQAFNHLWALSRYAILSLNSFENPRGEYLEDAIYYMSGAGWMTHDEIKSVVQFHRERGHATRIVKSIWRALSQRYPTASEFSKRSFLEYCVKRGMVFMDDVSVQFLRQRWNRLSKQQKKIGDEIINTINKKNKN